jgi:hypothetical protein
MELTIVNPQPKYQPAALMEPPALGYIHVAAAVQPPAGRLPFPGRGERKGALLRQLKSLATQLEALPEDDYVLVNHARWDDSLPRFALRQFGRRSFYRYVLGNMRANHVGAMPLLYRLA